MTREEENEWINNLSDEERDRLENEGCGIGCVDNALAVIGAIVIIGGILVFLFLGIFGEYDESGHFVRWIWQ